MVVFLNTFHLRQFRSSYIISLGTCRNHLYGENRIELFFSAGWGGVGWGGVSFFLLS